MKRQFHSLIDLGQVKLEKKLKFHNFWSRNLSSKSLKFYSQWSKDSHGPYQKQNRIRLKKEANKRIQPLLLRNEEALLDDFGHLMRSRMNGRIMFLKSETIKSANFSLLLSCLLPSLRNILRSSRTRRNEMLIK